MAPPVEMPAPHLTVVPPAPAEAPKPAAGKAAQTKGVPTEGASAKPAPAAGSKTRTPSPATGSSAAGDGARSGMDVEVLARNLAQMMEEGGKAMAAYMTPRQPGKTDDMAEDIADALKTVSSVAEYWMADPQRTVEAQSRLMAGYLSVWANTMKRLAGEEVAPVTAPDAKDARFKDEGWRDSPIFDALKQAYLVTAKWAEDMVEEAEGLDPHLKHKAEFLVRQVSNAISPSNFVFTNPELIRETLSSSGENLVKGMRNLTQDLIEGKGSLKIRQTDMSAFEVGRNLATTPGKVIFENELMQLIQYEATTATVKKTPLLIVPPWINKFYILDLTAEKSFIKWLVDQGVSVFVISWVNPDARLAAKGFDDYMREGIMTALDQVAIASGERQAHAMGYCVGGTLLATTLAYMAATGDDRIASATFLTTQIDFTHAGDLKVFVDEEQLASIERKMKDMGYLEGSKMASAFNLLRSNDLIWPYVVNNYMKGKSPFPFDLLFWNADSTRMPAANHSFYLRNCYLTNNIARGLAELGGIRIDVHKISVPVYSLATKEDHIAPPNSVYIGANLLSGPVRYVLAGSGHIAGVVNPPARGKYQYWADGPTGPSFDLWLEGARENAGSWWPDWVSWFSAQHPDEVPARTIGGDRLAPIEDAPGRYVRARS
ncbi:class I poly(R)-hydroxyalkanoic acid synthase [Xanthobacter autotrophicus]|uniref:class I poly(R)-hydroxyalkanoic acid synthase n=1 Tax=Xanthobacter autotrophicus TaxID=280 RepID=UPI0024A7777D|nr:class I poly(R)-hydroxyalkanoic acid synthase [Xanthobacter autotrophicus]MDI4656537.1 class I poly(R)-hydroxyalkanoic acid synthase [Xanthobacter autotrophicus]